MRFYAVGYRGTGPENLVGFTHALIWETIDYMKLTCGPDERGCVTEATKRRIVKFNAELGKWVWTLAQCTSDSRFKALQNSEFIPPQKAEGVPGVYVRLNLFNNDSYIGETAKRMSLKERVKEHFTLTYKHYEGNVNRCTKKCRECKTAD